ncbi:tetratricopeptide repeat protein [Micromonospora sp. NPDC049497]|uniref:tetratricopeptide repeat protein n=1 Tax=Micromonospora sp. NPDC049497 TaxID=3364273 RepID=UPI003793EF1D
MSRGHRAQSGTRSYPLGLADQQTGQLDEALQQHHRALELFRRFDDRRCEGLTLAALGDTFHATDQPDEVQRCWQQALEILDPLGGPHADTSTPANRGVEVSRDGRRRAADGVRRFLEDPVV